MSEEVGSIIAFSEDIQDAKPPAPLPNSDYPAEIVAAEAAISGAGNRYAAVTFKIPVDAFPADFDLTTLDDPSEGITVVYRRVSLEDTNNGRWSLRRFCEAIGAAMGREIDLNDWVGRTATVTTAIETYEGVDRTTIKSVKEAV